MYTCGTVYKMITSLEGFKPLIQGDVIFTECSQISHPKSLTPIKKQSIKMAFFIKEVV